MPGIRAHGAPPAAAAAAPNSTACGGFDRSTFGSGKPLPNSQSLGVPATGAETGEFLSSLSHSFPVVSGVLAPALLWYLGCLFAQSLLAN